MKTNWERCQRRILTEFIKIYQSEPCLWMVKSPEYRDRHMKDLAYERLSAKLRELDPEADRERVVKKINSLRTNYRKEKKKLEDVRANGKQPRLWYLPLFEFLERSGETNPNNNDNFDINGSPDAFDNFEEEEDVRSGSFTFEDLEEIDQSNVEEQDDQRQDEQIFPSLDQKSMSDLKCDSHEDNNTMAIPKISMTSFDHGKSSSSKRMRSNELSDDADADDDEDQRIPVRERRSVRGPKSLSSEDRYGVFARMIVMKLRAIRDERQRLLAEKAINDSLFMAEIGELTLDHVNMLSNLVQIQPEIEFINSTTNRRNSSIANQENCPVRMNCSGRKRC